MGWTGDAQVFALTGSYIADSYGFMDQWMDTVRSDCDGSGMSTQYSPAFEQYDVNSSDAIVHDGQSFGITWNALVVTIPYNLYMQTGKTSIIKENIDNIYAYIDTLLATPYSYKDSKGEKKEESRLTGETGTLADHLSRVSTNKDLLGNAVFIACLDEASVMANVLGDTDKANKYRELADEACDAWNELFIDKKSGKTITPDGVYQDTQASYATPLRFGIVSDENLEKVLENYLLTITDASGTGTDELDIVPYTITTGFNATGNVLNALSMNGKNDVATKLFESTEFASWLYPVTQGATSIWERWNSQTSENGFGGNNAMNSFNHYSFGAVGEWMMAYQGGITALDGSAGYKSFVLQPTAGGDFTDLTVSYDSEYGTITSSWSADGGVIKEYSVTVPANTTAVLYLPTTAENGQSAEGATYVENIEHNGITTAVYKLVSGNYIFTVSDTISVQ